MWLLSSVGLQRRNQISKQKKHSWEVQVLCVGGISAEVLYIEIVPYVNKNP